MQFSQGQIDGSGEAESIAPRGLSIRLARRVEIHIGATPSLISG